MNELTKKQEEALREFLHSAVVPLIEDVLVKKLGQAMSYAKEQLATPKQWVGLTAGEMSDIWCETTGRDWVNEDTHVYGEAIEAKLKEKNT